MYETLLIGLGGFGCKTVEKVYGDTVKKFGDAVESSVIPVYMDMDPHDLNEMGNEGYRIFLGRNERVRDIMDAYSQMGFSLWFPQSPLLLHSVLVGTGTARAMGRLCFAVAMETGMLGELDRCINRLMENSCQGNRTLRVVIVTSLAGSFGSGMFIQLALYIRRKLEMLGVRSQICGQLVMPEVFIRGFGADNIPEGEIQRMSANAYASVKELSFIDGIMRGAVKADGEHPVRLDGLFDSERDFGCGKNVFDSVYLFEGTDFNGRECGSLDMYRDNIANAIEVRFFSSMTPYIDSDEDAAFIHSLGNGLVCNAMGVGALIYPYKDVLEYCAARRILDMTDSWLELGADKVLSESDRFLVSVDAAAAQERKSECVGYIDKNTKNTCKKILDDGKVAVIYSDKVEDYLFQLDKLADTLISQDPMICDMEHHICNDSSITNRAELEDFVHSSLSRTSAAVSSLKSIAEDVAERIMLEVTPGDEYDVNLHKAVSLAGLLSSVDESSGRAVWVDPIAALYLLSKLCWKLKVLLGGECSDARLKEVYFKAVTEYESGGDGSSRKSFREEEDPVKRLDKKPFFMSEHTFISEYVQWYRDYCLRRKSLCVFYTKALVKSIIAERLIVLSRHMMEFYCEAMDRIREGAYERVTFLSAYNKSSGNVRYVYASAEAKEHIYRSLTGGYGDSGCIIAQGMAELALESLCKYLRRRSFVEISNANGKATEKLLEDWIGGVKEKILYSDADKICCDIASAIYAEEELQRGAEYADDEERSRVHRRVLISAVQHLQYMARPYIRYGVFSIKDTARHIDKLCYNSRLIDIRACLNDMGMGLVNFVESASCAKNELICCDISRGMALEGIYSFNRNNGGIYCVAYNRSIAEMERTRENGLPDAHIITPHMDSTWHKIMIDRVVI